MSPKNRSSNNPPASSVCSKAWPRASSSSTEFRIGSSSKKNAESFAVTNTTGPVASVEFGSSAAATVNTPAPASASSVAWVKSLRSWTEATPAPPSKASIAARVTVKSPPTVRKVKPSDRPAASSASRKSP